MCAILALGPGRRSEFFDREARVNRVRKINWERKVRTPQGRMLRQPQGERRRRVSRRDDGKCHRKQTARRGIQVSIWSLHAGKGEKVGQEPTAPSAMTAARKTPSGARQNRRLGGPSHSRGYAAAGCVRVSESRRPRSPQGARERNDDRSAARRGTESGLSAPRLRFHFHGREKGFGRPEPLCEMAGLRVWPASLGAAPTTYLGWKGSDKRLRQNP